MVEEAQEHTLEVIQALQEDLVAAEDMEMLVAAQAVRAQVAKVILVVLGRRAILTEQVAEEALVAQAVVATVALVVLDLLG